MGDPLAESLRADPARVLAGLDRLRELSGSRAGAQRVAWTPAWASARAWLRDQLEQLPVTIEVDAAGNLWAALPGVSVRSIVVGSHLDSVPDGGWLDGCLGVIAGLEILRAQARGPTPLKSVRLVDWADEEGVRFGRGLFGSGAAAGLLEPDSLRDLKDAEGARLPEVLAEHGVDLGRAPRARARLHSVDAYLELHIEQGPALEAACLPLGVVQSIYGIRRHRLRFHGHASHAGSTPMDLRRDALASAARFVLAVREGARRHGGVATIGELHVAPGIPTAVPGGVTLVLDQRHREGAALRRMLDDAREDASAIAAREATPVRWTAIHELEPIGFDDALAELAERCVRDVAGDSQRIRSGALHDAAMVAKAGVPTAMLFVQSIRGISHSAAEDSHAEHIEAGVRALDQLVRRLLSAPPS
jgi:beta-ureidopropionase / N-carbamoyl-L-amino-acid hydrolase